jgi:hypothetical protein
MSIPFTDVDVTIPELEILNVYQLIVLTSNYKWAFTRYNQLYIKYYGRIRLKLT